MNLNGFNSGAALGQTKPTQQPAAAAASATDSAGVAHLGARFWLRPRSARPQGQGALQQVSCGIPPTQPRSELWCKVRETKTRMYVSPSNGGEKVIF